MAYTCACYPSEDATLEEAQAYKHDLVARKLGLRPGMRLLDVGCGWGGMVMHAAREYGVKALGVTLSEQQALWAQQAIEERGLSDLAEVRHLDYRDVAETDFDAVSSIGLTEHIGKAQLPGYFAFLYGKLKPEGRLLNHCITRTDDTEPARRPDGFIYRYVFPDGELEAPGYLVSLMHDAGFEVRHEENLREHYAKTLAGWCANLDEHWDEAVAEVGEGTARVWRLYMAGSRLGFERNQIQLHQVLGVRLGDERQVRHAAAPRLGAGAVPSRSPDPPGFAGSVGIGRRGPVVGHERHAQRDARARARSAARRRRRGRAAAPAGRLVVRARPVELAVPDHHSVRLQHGALVLGVGRAAALAGQLPGDALRDDPSRRAPRPPRRAGCACRRTSMRLLRSANFGMSAARSGRSVSWCRTTSGPNAVTAPVSASASNTSQTTDSAPSSPSMSAFCGERVIPATVCPSATSSGIRRTPMTPLAPATKIRTAIVSSQLYCPGPAAAPA